jgi:hypothetical protein
MQRKSFHHSASGAPVKRETSRHELEPDDADYQSLQQQVADILGVNNQVPATSEAAWSIAEKVANVAGVFFGALLK